jgi:hypothetical protein
MPVLTTSFLHFLNHGLLDRRFQADFGFIKADKFSLIANPALT